MMFRSFCLLLALPMTLDAFCVLPKKQHPMMMLAPLAAKQNKNTAAFEESFSTPEEDDKAATLEASALPDLKEGEAGLQDLSAKASAFLQDERVQEISTKAGEFAKDTLGQLFQTVGGAVGGKLKELKKQKEEQKMAEK